MITVKAAAGLRVPMEGMPRRYVTDAEAVTVPGTAYYRRRIADGDLLAVADQAAAPAAGPEAGPAAKEE